ncbi:hypothetical protein N7533_008819 [Penicillium manginii]|uniref:uncharacterized protein n=1 Tax=Penicillium manginii TaxID=203109 RepID=UPI0025481070|nr:uncharacterized protein N7533_008819 [Penicillium manginii]KAJ5743949.1 hypothetical protein N7533_008819 [Penicillium manginii]
MGTATFNSQYNADPYALPTTELVHRALSHGIRAFDTSPYYGPAEDLLGAALSSPKISTSHPRNTYHLLTKVGRVASSSFDYSPPWLRASVRRSLSRLHTTYLRRRLLPRRRIRQPHRSPEPPFANCATCAMKDSYAILAEMILRETGEPLDIVMSYANFTLQNTRLATTALPRLLAAGVDVVPNASPLGMGLLRRDGVPIGSMGDFHPAPDALRAAVRDAASLADVRGEKLEVVAIRFALESWLRDGAAVGGLGAPVARGVDSDPGFISVKSVGAGRRLGVSVMGVSNVAELDETLRVWNSIVEGLENCEDGDGEFESKGASTPTALTEVVGGAAPSASNILTPSEGLITDRAWSRTRRANILQLAAEIRQVIGEEWVDYVWASPDADFKNSLSEEHLALVKRLGVEGEVVHASADDTTLDEGMLTPPLDVERQLE